MKKISPKNNKNFFFLNIYMNHPLNPLWPGVFLYISLSYVVKGININEKNKSSVGFKSLSW